MNFQKRNIETEDDWSGLSNVQEYEYFHILGTNQNYNAIKDQDLLLEFVLRLDSETMDITRSAYPLTDLFGDIGGVLQIITIVMALLLASYSE